MAKNSNSNSRHTDSVPKGEGARVFSFDPDSLWNENQRLQADLRKSLAERNRLLKRLNESSGNGRVKGGSRVLEERLSDVRSRLAELEHDNSRLSEALNVTRERLESAEQMPGPVIDRIDEMTSLITGLEAPERRAGADVDQLSDQLNRALESLWRVLRVNGSFENASLKREVAELTSALETRRREVKTLRRDKEAAQKDLATAEEGIRQLVSNNALRDSRLSALQNRVVDLEEENRRLAKSNLKLKTQVKDLRGVVDPESFSRVVQSGDPVSQDSGGWLEHMSPLPRQWLVGIVGLVLGVVISAAAMWLFPDTRMAHVAPAPGYAEPFMAPRVSADRPVQAPVSDSHNTVTLPQGPVWDRLKGGDKGPVMLPVMGGEYRMGTDRYSAPAIEKPARLVRVEPFLMGRYEVSFEQYDVFARAAGRPLPDDQGRGRGYRPVVNITWEEASAYALWLSEQTGHTYRLPSEAEWEFAMSAGGQALFWWGNEPKSGMENCLDCGSPWGGTAHPVGSVEPNPLGLYDMGGNVMEWVANCMQRQTTPWSTEVGCATRVVRGGAFDRPMQAVRTTARRGLSGKTGYPAVGFRLVREAR